jgi:hypothetical protein
VLLYAEAARNANLSFTDSAQDRTRLRNALETVAVDTPMGFFQFTSQHDVHQTIWILAMDGAGAYRLVKSVPTG